MGTKLRYMVEIVADIIAAACGIFIMSCVYMACKLRIVRMEYDADASVRLVVFGCIAKRWLPHEFIGWGHPFAPLFTRDWE